MEFRCYRSMSVNLNRLNSYFTNLISRNGIQVTHVKIFFQSKFYRGDLDRSFSRFWKVLHPEWLFPLSWMFYSYRENILYVKHTRTWIASLYSHVRTEYMRIRADQIFHHQYVSVLDTNQMKSRFASVLHNESKLIES